MSAAGSFTDRPIAVPAVGQANSGWFGNCRFFAAGTLHNWLQWQADLEAGAQVAAAVQPQPTIMCLDDCPAYRQAYTSAAALG